MYQLESNLYFSIIEKLFLEEHLENISGAS